MADEPQTPAEAAPEGGEAPVPGMRIMAQYIRDLSFENPRAPDSLRGGVTPTIDMQVELGARARPDGLHEVDLKLMVSAKREEEVAFHCELLYGGLFQLENIPDDQMEGMLLIECPRYMFPFARRIIADLTSEGGFPPFRIEPLDFLSIYMARREQMQQQANGAAALNA